MVPAMAAGGVGSDGEEDDPRPKEAMLPSVSAVRSDIVRVGEEIPGFMSQFDASEFMALADRIHGRLPSSGVQVSDGAAGEAATRVLGDMVMEAARVLGEAETEHYPRAVDRVHGRSPSSDEQSSSVFGAGLMEDGATVAHAGEAAAWVLSGVTTEAARVLGGGSTKTARALGDGVLKFSPAASNVKGCGEAGTGIKGGGGGGMMPLQSAPHPLARFASIKTTPEVSLVRRLPVRGSFQPTAGEGDCLGGNKGTTAAAMSFTVHGAGEPSGRGALASGGQEVTSPVKVPAVAGQAEGGVFPGSPRMDTTTPAIGDSIRFGSLDFKFSS